MLTRRGSGQMTVHVPRGRIPLGRHGMGAGGYDPTSPLEQAALLSAGPYGGGRR